MALSDKSQCGMSELSAGNVALCKRLYGALKSKSGNIFFSPASLEFALALLYAGTEGETAKQIRSNLLLPESKEKTYSAVSSSLASLKSARNVTLNIADGLFVHEKFTVNPAFMDIAVKYFASQVANVNFESPDTVKIVNNFVAKETQQKITELFQPDSFDALTRLVIVNAIYFKGNWASKFDPTSTFKGDFHLNKKDKVQVEFMKQKSKYGVGSQDGLNATIVVMPYEGEKLSMVLVVPNEVDGLKEVEEKLLELDLANLVKNTYSEEIILTMPKFKLSQTLNLKGTLCDLGMSDMFSDKANLKGISDEPLYVSDVVQKTYIEVSEEGTEAAAATGIVMLTRMMPIGTREVTVDSPFLFMICDENESVLFIGRMSQP